MISLEPLDPTMSEANSIRGLFNYEKINDMGMWEECTCVCMCFAILFFCLNHLELDLCYLEPQLIHLV